MVVLQPAQKNSCRIGYTFTRLQQKTPSGDIPYIQEPWQDLRFRCQAVDTPHATVW